MLCLHGKPTGEIKTKKGTLLTCQQPSTCHFSCSEDQKYLHGRAVECFLRMNQDRPLCCMGEDGTRNYAKMKVDTVTALGRPFFVCSKEDDPCNYFAWGDKRIIPRPVCKHGKPSQLVKVNKERPTKERKSYFACGEPVENRCRFFKWYKEESEDLAETTRRILNTHSMLSFAGI